jgi:hypothetical protein
MRLIVAITSLAVISLKLSPSDGFARDGHVPSDAGDFIP